VALALVHVERDGRALDSDDLAPELADLSDGAAELAGPNLRERVCLLVGRRIVDEEGNAVIASEDVAGMSERTLTVRPETSTPFTVPRSTW
jgi:hypothetical protein